MTTVDQEAGPEAAARAAKEFLEALGVAVTRSSARTGTVRTSPAARVEFPAARPGTAA